MSVSQANGSAPHASRRRRRGGRGGGNGNINRGDTRPTLWREGNARAGTVAASSDWGDSGDGGKQQNGGVPFNAPARGKGKASGSGVGGKQGKGSRPGEEEGCVHPAMLESEFLASTGQSDADASGVASLSLEEVPYDRDLRWCNTSSSSRPRPTMDTNSGVFGRVGTSITQDTGDYERLDRHYQELWKDREENGPPPPPRGRGNRAGRGGRTRGRCSNGGGGSSSGGNGGGPPRSSTPNGPGREDATRHGTPSKRNRGGGGGGVGRTGARGGRGAGNRSPAEKGGESGAGGRGAGPRGVASSPHSNGGGGAGASTVAQRRGQRGGGNSMGRSGGKAGAVVASKGVLHSSAGSSSRNPQPLMAPAFRVQEAAVVAAAMTRATTPAPVATVPSWQGRIGGGSPARAARNGHHRWEGPDQRPPQPPSNQHQHHPLTPGFGPWVMEPGQSRSPVGPTGFARAPDGGAVVMRTPPLIPSMPPMIGGPRPDSPEYLGDLANALSAAPFAERTSEEPSESMELADQPIMRQRQHSLAMSMSSPLGPELLGGSAVDDRNGFGGGEGGVGGGGGGGITAAQNGGAALSPYLSPRRTKASPDIRAITNPSLEFDIQDICADPDLNVNAPAFVPGCYLST